MNQMGVKKAHMVMSDISHVGVSAITRLIENRYMAVGYHQLIDSGYEVSRDLGNETQIS
jgi:hypothetical protein